MIFSRRRFFGSIVPIFIAAVALFAGGSRCWAIIDATLQMQLGNPSGATANATNHDHYLFQRTVEAMDYSDHLGEPNWASWDLTTEDVGSSGRGNFAADPAMITLGFTQVGTGDYPGGVYDRGHMCPSGDRTDSDDDNALVFYMSNMIPQSPDNNQGPWASFESYCRTLASAGNEILITCGPSLFDGSRIPSNKAAIPQYTWKIAVVVPLGSGTALSRISITNRVIAIKMPNIQGIRSTPWQTFVTNVSTIQNDTGFTFFSAVPSNTAAVWRGIIDGTAVPTITSFSGSSGAAGTSVVITGANLTGALAVAFNGTTATYTVNSSTQITATVPAGATTGAITVNTPGGQATSASNFTVSSGGPVVINTQPVSRTTNAGSTVIFSVAASGGGTLNYQWLAANTNLVNGGNISGAASSALTLANVGQTNAGSYSVIITNSTSGATSTVATLTVITPPVIVTQPLSQTNPPGGTAIFSVGVTGTTPLTVQWKKGITNLINSGNVTGVTTTNLTLSSLAVADGGSYSVVITNSAGAVTSSPAILVVAGTNQTVTFGALSAKNYGDAAFPLFATASSGLAVQFSVLSGGATITGTNLTITSSGPITVRASQPGNSNYNAAAVVDQSFTVAKVALSVTANNVSRAYGVTNPTFTGSISGVVSGDAITAAFSTTATINSVPGTYTIVAGLTDAANRQTNYNVSLTNAILTVTSVAPTISTQPQNTQALTGQDAVFQVSATGSPTLNYFWKFNGTTISGATQSSYTASSVQTTNAGSYSVLVTNSAGSILSSNAILTVTVGSLTNIVLAQWDFNETNTAPVANPGPFLGTGTLALVGGTTSAYVSGSGSTDIAATNIAWNVTTFPVSNINNKLSGAQFNVSTLGYKNIMISWDQKLSASASKYYRLQYSTNGSAFLDFNVITMTNTSTFQSFSNNLTGLAGVDNNSNFALRVVSEFESTAAGAGNAYDVTVAGGNYSTGGTAHFDMMTVKGVAQVSAIAPAITSQPQGQNTLIGSNITFTASASGTAPLNYQWQWGGTNIATATSSTLTLTNVQLNQSGNYRVVVTNSAGSAASSNAVLSVYATVAASLSGSVHTTNHFQFGITGYPGASYIIQAADDLFSLWTSIQTNTAPFTFTDTNTVGHARRFYRVLSNP